MLLDVVVVRITSEYMPTDQATNRLLGECTEQIDGGIEQDLAWSKCD